MWCDISNSQRNGPTGHNCNLVKMTCRTFGNVIAFIFASLRCASPFQPYSENAFRSLLPLSKDQFYSTTMPQNISRSKPIRFFTYEWSGAPVLLRSILDAANHVQRRPNEFRQFHIWFTGVSGCILWLRVLILGTFNTFTNKNLCTYWLIYSWFNIKTAIIP